MCWRDNVPMSHACTVCGKTYYGALGHIGCSGARAKGVSPPVSMSEEHRRELARHLVPGIQLGPHEPGSPAD
jgi:hypothetical protein